MQMETRSVSKAANRVMLADASGFQGTMATVSSRLTWVTAPSWLSRYTCIDDKP